MVHDLPPSDALYSGDHGLNLKNGFDSIRNVFHNQINDYRCESGINAKSDQNDEDYNFEQNKHKEINDVSGAIPDESNASFETDDVEKEMSQSDADLSGDWHRTKDRNNNSPYKSFDYMSKNLDSTINESWTKAGLSPEMKYKNVYSLSNNLNRRSLDWKARISELKSETANEIETEILHKRESVLNKIREYLADFQECRGTPRVEYSFSSLIKVMGLATGRSLLALFYVILNIAPVIEIFLHISRFVIDKLINIQNTSDVRQAVVKCILFIIQLLSVYVCLVFIFGFIVLPVIKMTCSIVAKVLLYD